MDGGAVQLSGDQFHGVEQFCEMLNPTNVRGMNAVLYDMQCQGEGETYSYRSMFMWSRNGMLMMVTDGFVSSWERCP